jgi:NADH dehydrogenase [ubiquinone] 1 alpha subcomplex assembly factor 7
MGARVTGPVEQAVFLRTLGIGKRAAALKSLASREKAAEIDGAIKRLTGEGRTEMGKLFKVVGIAHPSIGKLPGFEPESIFG